MRFLLVLAAFCVLMPIAQAQYTPRDCCDVATEWLSARDQFDIMDDRLDELEGSIQLGLMFQQQILMRVPFTPDDQQAWEDISRVILNASDEKDSLQDEQDALALRIIALNQELLTCHLKDDEEGPPTPIPDPMMP